MKMKPRKTSVKIRLVKLPDDTDIRTFKRSISAGGVARNDYIKDDDILDVYNFDYKYPRLLYIMDKLGLISSVYVKRMNNALMVFRIVPRTKGLTYYDIEQAVLMYGGEEELGDEDDVQNIKDVCSIIMGLQFLLKEKTVFEFDACLIEGITTKEIEDDMEDM